MSASKTSNFLIATLIIIFSSFFSLKYLGGKANAIQKVTVAVMFLLVFVNSFKKQHLHLFTRKYVLMFIVVSLLGAIPALIVHEQSIVGSILALFLNSFILFFFFILINSKISEKQLFKILLIFSLFYVFMELIQQLTYPAYWFAGREGNEYTGELEIRQDMYKFYMTGIHLVILCAFYVLDKLFDKFSVSKLFLFSILVVGIYGFLARKMVFALMFCLPISFLLKKKIKWYLWVLLILLSVGIYIFSDVLLGTYLERTNDELTSEDFIRYQAMSFFLTDFPNKLSLWLGNGMEYAHSAYGKYITSLQENFYFYRADVGIIAYFSRYGIIGLTAVGVFLVFLIKKWKFLPLYIKLYFIFWGIQVIFAFPLNSPNGTLIFVIVLYLIELHLQQNKMKSTKYLKYEHT